MYESSKYLAELDNVDKKVQVQDLFSKSLQIPRIKMPQVEKEFMDDVLIHFSKNFRVYKEKVPVSKLAPTQCEYSHDKVKRHVANGGVWDLLPFLVSQDYKLLDGHHRWVQGMFLDPDKEVTVYRLGVPTEKALNTLNRLKFVYNNDLEGNKVVPYQRKPKEMLDAVSESDLVSGREYTYDPTGNDPSVVKYSGEVPNDAETKYNFSTADGSDISLTFDQVDNNLTECAIERLIEGLSKSDAYQAVLKNMTLED